VHRDRRTRLTDSVATSYACAGQARREAYTAALEHFLVSVGLMANGVELKAERRKPSGEKHCDIENLPSLTGVLALFRLHSFNAIGLYAVGAKICSYRGGFDDRDGAATSFSCAKSVSTKVTTTMSASGLFSTRLLGFSPLVTPLPFACNIQ